MMKTLWLSYRLSPNLGVEAKEEVRRQILDKIFHLKNVKQNAYQLDQKCATISNMADLASTTIAEPGLEIARTMFLELTHRS